MSALISDVENLNNSQCSLLFLSVSAVADLLSPHARGWGVVGTRTKDRDCEPDTEPDDDDDDCGKPSGRLFVGMVPIPLGGGMPDFKDAGLPVVPVPEPLSVSFRLSEPDEDPGRCELALPMVMGTVSRSQRSSSSPGVRVLGYGRRNILSGDCNKGEFCRLGGTGMLSGPSDCRSDLLRDMRGRCGADCE